MQKSTLSTIGAVVSAVLASLCCLGPLALAALGVAGLGSAGLAAFTPYRPYLIGATMLLLGVAFFVTYRKSHVACQEGEACAVLPGRKTQKVGLWVITGITGLVLTIPYLPWAANSSTPVAGPTEVAYLKVSGMDCEACAAGIAAALTRDEGIAGARIDYEKGEAIVTYTPTKTTPEQIARLITDQGYPATPVSKPTSQTSDDTKPKVATVTLRVSGMT